MGATLMTGPLDRAPVVLAHAFADSEVARAIVQRMEQRGFDALVHPFAVDDEPNVVAQVRTSVPARGFLVVLTSAAMLQTRWIERHLDDGALQDLLDRGVTIIPVTMDDVDLPKPIAHLQRIAIRSSSADLDRLADQIDVAPLIDFESLSPKLFESLVYDLLLDLGFRDSHEPAAERPPVGDFVVELVSNDPFGSERTDTWVVEAKHYRNERADPYGVWQLASYVGSNRRQISKGLLITNGRLTSSTRRTLAEVEQRSGSVIRVVDGAELRALLVKHPDVATRYFRTGAAAQANG